MRRSGPWAANVRIVSVDVIPLRAPLSAPRGPSILTYHRRETLFIKVQTDTGLVGWGETYRLAGVEGALRNVLTPLLLGRDPRQLRTLHAEMRGATFDNGFAVGGIDLALHDLSGKALGVPVHQVYGGALRSSVEAYASLAGYYDDRSPEDHWVAEARALVEQGFRGMKFRVGRFNVRRELSILARVRDAVGDAVRLMADANAAYSPAQALQMADGLRDLDFEWLEEPLPQGGYLGYPEVRRKMPLPLAGGEGLLNRPAAASSLERGCFDIVQPDVSICGGIGETLFIGELARLSTVRCIPHCWAGALTLGATLQVTALLPELSRMPGNAAPLLEFDVTENPFRDDIIVGNPFALQDGCVAVPSGPGLGIEIDETALSRYGAQCG
jgi:D-galactarolactone cycloisomerase